MYKRSGSLVHTTLTQLFLHTSPYINFIRLAVHEHVYNHAERNAHDTVSRMSVITQTAQVPQTMKFPFDLHTPPRSHAHFDGRKNVIIIHC